MTIRGHEVNGLFYPFTMLWIVYLDVHCDNNRRPAIKPICLISCTHNYEKTSKTQQGVL